MSKIFSFLLYGICGLIIVGLGVLFVAPSVPAADFLDAKIVKSGSMEPAIMTGAVVVIKEAANYGIGDVITFTEENSKIPTTHRIVGMENVSGVDFFVTKGDANEEADANLVSPNNVIGKVVFDLPYVGFVLDFARQPMGFAFLVGIPALLIILDELAKIWREVRRIRQIKFTKEMIMPLVVAPFDPNKLPAKEVLPVVVRTRLLDIKPIEKKKVVVTEAKISLSSDTAQAYHDIKPRLTMATAAIAFLVILAGQSTFDDSTFSYLKDIETSVDNSLKAQTLDFSISPNYTSLVFVGGQLEGGGLEVILTPHLDNVEELVYDVLVEKTSGQPAFCDDLIVEAGWPLVFSGSLLSLVGSEVSFTNPWSLGFLMNQNNHVGESCEVDIIFKGYLASSGDVSGYVVAKSLHLQFTATDSAPAPLVIDTETEMISEEVEESHEVESEEPSTPNVDTYEEVEIDHDI